FCGVHRPITSQTCQFAYGLGAATNLILTIFTAGRILWIQRVASHAGLDNTVRRRSNMAIGIVLESGAIYCIAAILLACTASRYSSESDSTSHYMVIGIAGQLLGLLVFSYILQVFRNIIPTFTLVYVGLKNTVEDLDGRIESKGTPLSNRILNEGNVTRVGESAVWAGELHSGQLSSLVNRIERCNHLNRIHTAGVGYCAWNPRLDEYERIQGT
ncbi:hypothetical protein K438DRAFT_2162139, partial [Mycena galopus ATCC 62051]